MLVDVMVGMTLAIVVLALAGLHACAVTRLRPRLEAARLARYLDELDGSDLVARLVTLTELTSVESTSGAGRESGVIEWQATFGGRRVAIIAEPLEVDGVLGWRIAARAIDRASSGRTSPHDQRVERIVWRIAE